MRDIDAVDMRCGHNVEKGEASTAHRILRTASGAAFCRRQIATSRRRACGWPCRRFQPTGSHGAPPALISCTPSVRLPIAIIFLLRDGYYVGLPGTLIRGNPQRECPMRASTLSQSDPEFQKLSPVLDDLARNLDAKTLYIDHCHISFAWGRSSIAKSLGAQPTSCLVNEGGPLWNRVAVPLRWNL
jgi:hypothetical protein